MMRCVLVLCAGLFGFAVDADAGCDIAAKIAVLAPGFSPANYGDCAPNLPCSARPPSEFIVKAAPARIGAAAITAAYDAAPGFFQNALCELDHIYIDTDTRDPAKPSVWGMRERRNIDPATGRPRKHIGISQQVLDAIAKQRTPYASYENQLARALLAPAPATPLASLAVMSYSTGPDPGAKRSAALTVLAILAHEMGHIVWWEREIGNSAFPQFSWSTKAVQHGFHNFGVEDPENPPQRHPVKADVQYDLRYLPPARAAADLRKIYSGEWASLFATVAADEDFVETYKLVVLTDTAGATPARQPLRTFKVAIQGAGPVDILALLNDPKTRLHEKASWVRDLVAH